LDEGNIGGKALDKWPEETGDVVKMDVRDTGSKNRNS
jgi:hypothetical protein